MRLRRSSAAFALLTALLAAGPAHAVPTRLWSLLGPAASPPGRSAHTMSFDAWRGRTVMFGGRVGATPTGDTWEFNGSTWLQRASSGPAARWEHSMAYDPVRKKTVLFGGLNAAGVYLNDTWEWDGNTWRRATPAASPPIRGGASFAFDPATQSLLLFGGSTSTARYDDTWTWDGTDWTARDPAARPPSRTSHVIETSPSGGVVLFGGYDGTTFLGDTWVWDGTTWTQQAPVTSPQRRFSSTMTFDSVRNETLLFGGFSDSTSFADTWAWDGVTWHNATPVSSPSARNNHAMAYDPSVDAAVVFGGSAGAGETWILEVREVDITPPDITPLVTPPANGAGWHRQNATLSWTVTEPETAVRSTSGCGSVTLTIETSGASFTCRATNVDGFASEATVTLRLDKTVPTIGATREPPPNQHGWNNQDVAISFACGDVLSGVATCPAPIFVQTEGTGKSASGTAFDAAGNQASVSLGGIRLDKTTPTTTIDTRPYSVMFASSSVISGSTVDGLSGVDLVDVEFEPVATGGRIKGSAFMNCNAGRTSCAWLVVVPSTPGAYRVHVKGIDLASNEELSRSIVVVVV